MPQPHADKSNYLSWSSFVEANHRYISGRFKYLHFRSPTIKIRLPLVAYQSPPIFSRLQLVAGNSHTTYAAFPYPP
jgi:hypothetical protein